MKTRRASEGLVDLQSDESSRSSYPVTDRQTLTEMMTCKFALDDETVTRMAAVQFSCSNPFSSRCRQDVDVPHR